MENKLQNSAEYKKYGDALPNRKVMSYARCPTPVSLYSSHNYHLNDLDSLGWELTVCNSLHPEKSPCRSVLKRSRSYGAALFDFLSR
ncbi:MAG: hypothetical protein ACE14T_04735, partial [Syntrophales bacterium]